MRKLIYFLKVYLIYSKFQMSKKNFIRKIFTFINKKLFYQDFQYKKKITGCLQRLIGMKLTGRRNFGDAVNKVFWSKITNKKILKDCSNEHFITWKHNEFSAT